MQLTKFCPHKVFGQFHSMKINPQDILYFFEEKQERKERILHSLCRKFTFLINLTVANISNQSLFFLPFPNITLDHF